jgi:hypothetical protein
MRNILFYIVSASLILTGCEVKQGAIRHEGEKILLPESDLQIDSIVIDATYTSGDGNFFMIDSVITFADRYYATMFDYDRSTGYLIGRHFELGRGENELSNFLYAFPVQNDTVIYVVNRNLMVTSYNPDAHHLTDNGMINFNWKNRPNQNYESPQNYNLMTNSLDIHFHRLNDSSMIIPVNIITSYTAPDGKITKKHYREGRVFGLLNTNTMTVDSVFGRFPRLYMEKSMPYMESFSYLVKGDSIFVNFAADPLIYVYKYPDQPLFTIGHEGKEINREYPVSTFISDDYYSDYEKMGSNMEITYFDETRRLFRTYIKSWKSKRCGMQVYDEGYNLIHDVEVPSSFKIVGYRHPYYYAVASFPEETEENTYFKFYRFTL